MKRALLLVFLMLGGYAAAAIASDNTIFSAAVTLASANQSSPQTAGTAMSGKIGPTAVWQPPQDFLANAHTACDKAMGNPPDYGQCFIDQMSKAGAPPDAVSFTRMLYQQNDGQVGILERLKSYGAVDAAQVFYPLRANDNFGLLLVNGDPKILDVDDLKKLDQQAMKQDPMFLSVQHKFPNTDVWPGDRSGNEPWPRVQPLPNGDTQFVVTYPLINGCHACQHVGLARFGWDFDAAGKFLRTTFIPTPPPPKILHERPPRPAPPSTPQ